MTERKKWAKVTYFDAKTKKIQIVSEQVPVFDYKEPVRIPASRTYLLCKIILQMNKNLRKLNMKTNVSAHVNVSFCSQFIRWYERKFAEYSITSTTWQ